MHSFRTVSAVCMAWVLSISGAICQTSTDSAQKEHQVVVHASSQAGGTLHVTAEAGDEMMVGMKAVKGAPYSAETRSETVQLLPGGNRIVRSNNTRMYRDSEGRTRQEYLFRSTGNAGTMDLISINDPVTGISYSLHPTSKSAEKITYSGDGAVWTDTAGNTNHMKSANTNVFIRRRPGPEGTFVASQHTTMAHDMLIRVPEAEQFKQAYTTESLGVRVMEGLQVEGKRTTTTLPAGAIGNEQPIVTVSESWYSPDLQATIYSKRDDPITGTTIYQVTKLVRGEPDATLFQLPSDYTVNESKVNIIHKIIEKAPTKD